MQNANESRSPLLSDAAIADVVAAAEREVPAFARRLAEAGLTAEDITSVPELDRLPVLTKDQVVELQAAQRPFGGLVAAGAGIRRIFQSPGPIYEPQFTSRDHWGAAPALRAAGFGTADVVLNCFAYHLTPAGALLEEACFAVGATVVPGGSGAMDLQARAVADIGITGYTGTPSYLKALIDNFGRGGYAPERWRVERALVTGEPLPDSLRRELTRHVPTVHMAYGTAETGFLAYEDAAGSGLKVRDDVLIQICDLDTGRAITDGEGQIVVTLLRPDYPLIRFGTGDISRWQPAADGTRRLAGVLGRVGQGVKVRGMFLHPLQVNKVLEAVHGVEAYRMVVERSDHRDELRCEVVVRADTPADQVRYDVAERVRAGLRFNVAVIEVSQLTPDGPVIDDRRSWE
jgi:phenylacetate-coenzyme A ligase PaaK-like adenylate-forming protein